MATIEDVARKAGVSRTTVSHALSGKRAVAAETRARILAAAEDLHYHPNVTASSLRAGRTRTIGLSVLLDLPGRTLTHGRFAEFIEHIADRLNEHGHRLLILVTRDAAPGDLGRLARSGQVDGLLLLQVHLEDPRIDELRRTTLPFVPIGRPADAHGLVCVDADLREAGALAARHLFALGHTRLGFLGRRPVFGYQYHAMGGFRRAHRAAGVSLRTSQFLDAASPQGLHGTLQPFLRADVPLTALITTTDVEAVTALQLLASEGVRVPEDVSIITLGDSILTQLASPPITAVAFSVRDESMLAVDLLLKMLEGQPSRRPLHTIPVHLLSRHSTGPPGRRCGEGKARHAHDKSVGLPVDRHGA